MLITDIESIRAGHKTLAQYEYTKKPVERGYANRTLYINISDLTIKEKPVISKNERNIYGGKRILPLAALECCDNGYKMELP